MFAVNLASDAAAGSPWWLTALGLSSVVLLVTLNGFFVAAEFSLVAVRRTRVEELVREQRRGSSVLADQIKNLDRSIAATQLGITLASLALGWIGEPAVAELLVPLFASLGAWSLAAAHTVAIVIAFTFITVLHVVLGELAPKAIALQRPDHIALGVSLPLEIFIRLTRPIVVAMNGIANAFIRALGYRDLPGAAHVHSVDELGMLIEEVEEAGLLTEDQAIYVQNVFRLSRKKVVDCLVPLEKMAVLDLNAPPEKILEMVRQGAHTRMPVYDGAPDNIVGIVNTKDLFHLFSLKGVVILQDALYEPLYLLPDQPVADALRLFKKSHRPMAVVRAENGMTMGLITLEDVLEEIVGDIEDEHDRALPKLRWARIQALRSKRGLSIAKQGLAIIGKSGKPETPDEAQ
ncbi:MAG TPA: hemolysin family protein [Gemmatales bacterium]|nr:hemolysin family protein [Gemmatales bacterium]